MFLFFFFFLKIFKSRVCLTLFQSGETTHFIPFVWGFSPHVSQHEEIAANESFLLGRPQAKEKKKKKKKNSHVLK